MEVLQCVMIFLFADSIVAISEPAQELSDAEVKRLSWLPKSRDYSGLLPTPDFSK